MDSFSRARQRDGGVSSSLPVCVAECRDFGSEGSLSLSLSVSPLLVGRPQLDKQFKTIIIRLITIIIADICIAQSIFKLICGS